MSGNSKVQAIVNEDRKKIVSKIIEDMKREDLDWIEPWFAVQPHKNAITNDVYHGINRFHVGAIAYNSGFSDNRWATFNQIRKAGWKLKKGARSAIVEKWATFLTEEYDEEQNVSETTVHPYLQAYYRVFNADEIEGIPEIKKEQHKEDCTQQIAECLIESSRCRVVEEKINTAKACYFPTQDRINITGRENFKSDESFTRTLLHEMMHSTGHPKALNRPIVSKINRTKKEYAIEELVAELGALFACQELGIQSARMEGDFYENHVAYLKSWISNLENDPDYLLKAASKAESAMTYILERYKKTA